MPPKAAGKNKEKATGKPKVKMKKKPKLPYFWIAVAYSTPGLLKKYTWVKQLFAPPAFKVVTIQNGDVIDQKTCTLSRGLRKTAADMVCWVNLDGADRDVVFTNLLWPFDASLNTNNQRISVPAGSASAWFRISPTSGAPGAPGYFEYGIDTTPPSPGPVIISGD